MTTLGNLFLLRRFDSMVPRLGPGLACFSRLAWALALILQFLPVHALIQVGRGNSPVHDPGWPKGALEVANLKTRAGWMEGPPFGGGQWTFFYRGDAEALQATLDLFGAIDAPGLVVVLHEGPAANEFLKDPAQAGSDGRYDWSFEVWVPENWRRLFNHSGSFLMADHPHFRQPLAAPRLEIWLAAGRLEWERIKVPSGVVVEEARASVKDFPAGSAIRARLFEAETGQPFPGAVLTISTSAEGGGFKPVAQTLASATGVAELTGIASNSFRVEASAEGYVPRLLGYVLMGTNDFKEFNAKLARAAALTGQVLDEQERPLPGVRIRARNTLGPDELGYPMAGESEVLSDSEGRFRLAGLPVGSMQLWAWRVGYHHRWKPSEVVKIQAGAGPETPGHIVRMMATGRVHVQMVDAEGKPISQAPSGQLNVHIQPEEGGGVGTWGGSAHIDPKGQHTFENVPPGRYRLSSQPFLPGLEAGGSDATLVTVEPRQTVEARVIRR